MTEVSKYPAKLCSISVEQLQLMKKALPLCPSEKLTPQENYELGMLVACIQDTLDTEERPDAVGRLIHGFCL